MSSLSTTKFQVFTILKTMGIYYAIFTGMTLLSIIIFALSVSSGNFGINYSLDFSTIIFLGVVGATAFSEDFKMFMQNGFSRNKILMSALMTFGIISLVCTTINSIFPLLFSVLNLDKILSITLGFDDRVNFLSVVLNFAQNFAVMTAVYALAVFIKRLGKLIGFSILILIAFVFIFGIPITLSYFPPEFGSQVFDFVSGLLGFSYALAPDNSVQIIFNASPQIITLLCTSVVFTTISYLFLRKLPLEG